MQLELTLYILNNIFFNSLLMIRPTTAGFDDQNINIIDRFCFVSPSCVGMTVHGQSNCNSCRQYSFKELLLRRCRATVKRRGHNIIDGKNISHMHSPSEFVANILLRQERKIEADKITRKLKQRLQKIIKSLPSRGMSKEMCKELGIDDINDLFLDKGINEKVDDLLEKHF